MSQEVSYGRCVGPIEISIEPTEVVGDTIFLRAHTGNHIAGVLEWDELVQTVTQKDHKSYHTIPFEPIL